MRWNNAEKPLSDGRQGDREEVHLRASIPEESRELGPTCALSVALGGSKRTPGLKGAHCDLKTWHLETGWLISRNLK